MCRRFARLRLHPLPRRHPLRRRHRRLPGDTGSGGNQRGPFSAFASNGSGHWGYGTHWATVDIAKQLALKGCGSGCKVFWTTQDKCVAYAHSTKGGYWYAAGGAPTDQQAKQNALKFCQSGSAPPNSCVIAAAECR